MGKTKHTPWSIGHENGGGGSTVVDSRGFYAAHTARLVRDGKEVVTKEEAKANARLIAAAPELLEVAALLVRSVDEFERNGNPLQAAVDRSRLIEKAREAIAKAEGLR